MPAITEEKRWSRRALWFVGIWAASAATVGAAAYILRAIVPV